MASFYRRDLAEAATRLPGVTASWIGTAMVGRVVGDELRYVSLAAGPPRPDDLGRQLIVVGPGSRPDP